MRTIYIKYAIEKLLDVAGGCKWLSLGPTDCQCAKCQVDRMSIGEIEKLARELEQKYPEITEENDLSKEF